MKRLLPLLLGTLTLAAPLLTSSPARADEPEPVHRYGDQTPPPRNVRTQLFLTGAAVTAGFYAPVLGASYLWDEHHGAAQMRIPVAGPWLGLGKTKLCKDRPELTTCQNFLQITGAILLALDGIGQAGGVAIMLESLFLPAGPSQVVRGGDDAAYYVPRLTTPHVEAPRGRFTMSHGSFSVTPIPTVGGESDLGLSFVGSF